MSDEPQGADSSTKFSRRWLLRSTASLTAGLVAIQKTNAAAAEHLEPAATDESPDHDSSTGEIFDRDRHHHWDSV